MSSWADVLKKKNIDLTKKIKKSRKKKNKVHNKENLPNESDFKAATPQNMPGWVCVS